MRKSSDKLTNELNEQKNILNNNIDECFDNKNEDLLAEIVNYKLIINKKDEYINNLSKNNSMDEIDKYKNDIKTLQDKLINYNSTIENITKLELEIKKLNVEINKNNKLGENYSSINEDNKKLQGIIIEKNKEIKRIERKINFFSEETENLKIEIGDLKEKYISKKT